MAVEARLTAQSPWVGTPTQRRLIEEEATRRGVSLARVIRDAIDVRYDLADGEEKSGPAEASAVV